MISKNIHHSSIYLWLKKTVHNNTYLSKLNKQRRRIIDERRRKAATKYGAETARQVIDLLESNGFEPFLTAGTLLGAIRDGRILAHDDDVDIALRLEGASSWASLRSVLENAGYSIVREFSLDGEIREQAYQADGFTFDIFGFHHPGNQSLLRAYYFCKLDGVDYADEDDRSVKYIDLPDFEKLQTANLSGELLPVPDNATEVLQLLYGPNWRIPDPNWKTGTGWFLMEDTLIRRTVYL